MSERTINLSLRDFFAIKDRPAAKKLTEQELETLREEATMQVYLAAVMQAQNGMSAGGGLPW